MREWQSVAIRRNQRQSLSCPSEYCWHPSPRGGRATRHLGSCSRVVLEGRARPRCSAGQLACGSDRARDRAASCTWRCGITDETRMKRRDCVARAVVRVCHVWPRHSIPGVEWREWGGSAQFVVSDVAGGGLWWPCVRVRAVRCTPSCMEHESTFFFPTRFAPVLLSPSLFYWTYASIRADASYTV